MNRRGFLGAILAAGAAPAIVKASNLMPLWVPKAPKLWKLGVDGLVEELISTYVVYDYMRNQTIARFDVLVGGVQLGLDQRFVTASAAHLPGAKDLAVRWFDDEIRRRGFTWADAKPIPQHPNPKVIG